MIQSPDGEETPRIQKGSKPRLRLRYKGAVVRMRRFILFTILCLVLLATPVYAVADDTIGVAIDGEEIELPYLPYWSEKSYVMPIRPIVEHLGGEIAWDSKDNSVVITYGDLSSKFYPGSNRVTVNGEQKILTTATILSNGCTFVPQDFIKEALGYECRVYRNCAVRCVTLTIKTK